MALVAAEHDPSSRRKVFGVYLQHGVAGAVVLLAVTLVRRGEPAAIIGALGAGAVILIALFSLLALTLAHLKFNLTEEIFVSLAVTAYIAMFPLLGMVMSAWIAVSAAAIQRIVNGNRKDAPLESARTFALFATYGVPLILATRVYEALGGSIPQLQASAGAAARIAVCGILLIVTNNLIVARVERAYGYSWGTTFKTAAVDTSIYLVTIPYAILTTFAYGSIGWGGILASAFTIVIANLVGRKLAQIRGDREQLIQRLTSLTNIGKTISVDCSIDELLGRIYEECRAVMDAPVFSIALHDASTNELSFELNVVRGAVEQKARLPQGGGLNWWVMTNARPLLIGSVQDERRLGINAHDDGVASQAWLGVPMTVRDHVIGVISVQSFEKHAFTQGDVMLMTAIANQAAAAIENAHLYNDLGALNIALEHRVAERTNELRETNLRLIAADRSKNQFLASMSHELRTPLNAIIGFSAILLETSRELLPARLYKFLDNIKTAGSHLLELINEILDLAKIEAGKLEIQPQRFELAETVAAVDRVIKGMAAERGVTIVTRIDPEVTDVFLDESRVKQILLNLLSNAVKFSHENGSVQLNVGTVAERDSPLACEAVRIEVADSGIGIAEGDRLRIFDQFYQVGGRPQRGGTGLGLSLTRNFVELHRGTIDVESEQGRGSTFRIHLPRYYDRAAHVSE
ncbi:MAG TPA: ATP-binding protein [Thermoanaerobaculia bacterium]|jgi:signal transduction histidine kinase|nr:ATP-binding protein [Thermoanaerobaculia bacterium]